MFCLETHMQNFVFYPQHFTSINQFALQLQTKISYKLTNKCIKIAFGDEILGQ
jgi:hypothetical protein